MESLAEVEAFIRSNPPSASHISSFNTFIIHELPMMLKQLNIKFHLQRGDEELVELSFENVCVAPCTTMDENMKPKNITPQECRRKNLSYMSPIYVSVIEKKDGVVSQVLNRVVIGQVPVMVGSVICSQPLDEQDLDPKGYFIISGIERVLVAQRRNAYNVIQVYDEKGMITASVRSISEETSHSVLFEMTISALKGIHIVLPYLSSPVSIILVLRALGIMSTEEFLKHLELREDEDTTELAFLIERMYREASVIADPLDFIGSLASRKHETTNEQYAHQLLTTELFPHLGIYSSLEMRLDFLFLMIRKVVRVWMDKLESFEKDNSANKRFETSGILLSELYRGLFKNFAINIEDLYDRNQSLVDIINKMEASVTKGIMYCMKKGQWGVPKNNYVRQGVSQVLNRLSHLGTVSHLQRVMIPIGKESKNVKIRQIHASFFGYLCLYETPEGEGCGIVMNHTICTRITHHYSTNFLRDLILRKLGHHIGNEGEEMWINNTLRYKVRDVNGFIQQFKELRLEGVIPRDVSIAWDRHQFELHINGEKGRLIRPFWDRKHKAIVWMDPAEAQSVCVAMTPEEPEELFDYCEIHPCMIYGCCAGTIPFSDHNQSPRNVYESSMIKQAYGFFSTMLNQRYDSVYNYLFYPQKMLSSTVIGRAVGVLEMPAGINCVTAILTAGSYNAEDAVVINRAAIERGLFWSTRCHTHTIEEHKEGADSIKKFCIPDPAIQDRGYNYDFLDENGIVRRGTILQKKVVLVGRVQTVQKNAKSKPVNIDCSEITEDVGVVDRVDVFSNSRGFKVVRIVVRRLNIPEMGDKFANICAQKGTCGLIIDPEDMPFTRDGIAPDILINPNALPSRMTISMFLEMLLGKISIMEGTIADTTPFSENSTYILKKLENRLVHYGYDNLGWEMMVNGKTGKPLRCKVFIGPTYYQRLNHLVAYKEHARSSGNVTTLTRQPVAGRSKDGGLRMGEMERDGILSHGSNGFLKERLFDMSDAYHVIICQSCQVISNSKEECHICKRTRLIKVNMPFAAKLLFQMLQGCMINTKFEAGYQ